MNVTNSTQGNEPFTWTPLIPVPTVITLCSILLVWSLLGNVLVIAVFYCNQNLRTNLNYLIVNMAVSDLLVPLVAVPWMISIYMPRPRQWLVDGPLGAALCKLVPLLSDISPIVSSINMAIIAFYRFIAVAYPTRQQFLRSRKSRWMVISFPWIVALALFSPHLNNLRLTNEWGYTMCNYSWSPAFDYWTAQTIFISIVTAVGFIIPFIIIIVLHTITVYELRKSLNNVIDMIEEEAILSRQRRNRRIFSMLITIVLFFTICWCPIYIFFLLSYSRHPLIWPIDYETYFKIQFSFFYMWFLLAAINPCIYFVFLRDFRQGLKNLCCRKTASANEPIARQPRPPGGDSNQNPECRPLHIYTTSV